MSASLNTRSYLFFWLLSALVLLASGAATAATKTLTIKGSNAESGDTIQIPDTAQVNVQVTDQGITIVMPDLDLRLQCLGDATAEGYCYVAVEGSTSGGAASSSAASSSAAPATTPATSTTTTTATATTAPAATTTPVATAGAATDNSEYCAGAPAGVICDPNADGRRNAGGTMDPWGGGWGFENTPIPNGKVVAYPFLANKGTSGDSGLLEFTNNMAGLRSSGYRWKGWFSATPGGEVLNDNNLYCQFTSADPNPAQIKWSQAANPGKYECNLGQAERVLYFNMTVGCFNQAHGCTVGKPFPGQPGYDAYYVKVYPR